MYEEELQSHISQIQTLWSMIPLDARDREATEMMANRYGRAVKNYLLASLRDSNAADDVYQEFFKKIASGAFGKANQSKGRFRDYLKKAVSRQIVDHYRVRSRQNVISLNDVEVAPPELDPSESESFDESWRAETLCRVFTLLERDDERSDKFDATVLRCRIDNPDLSSEDLAEALSEKLNRKTELTAANARQLVRRARLRFAGLLLLDTAEQIESTDPDRIEEELAALKLLEYVRPAMAEWRQQRG